VAGPAGAVVTGVAHVVAASDALAHAGTVDTKIVDATNTSARVAMLPAFVNGRCQKVDFMRMPPSSGLNASSGQSTAMRSYVKQMTSTDRVPGTL